MKKLNGSIQAKVTAMVVAFAIVLLSLWGIAAQRLMRIDQATDEVEQKWLVDIHLLHELDSLLLQLRVDERTQLEDEGSASLPDTVADSVRKRDRLVRLRDEILSHSPELSARETAQFRETLGGFVAAHDAWSAAAVTDRTGPGMVKHMLLLRWTYRSAAEAVDRLIDTTTDAAIRAMRRTDGLVHQARILLNCVAAFGLVFTCWVAVQIRLSVTRPLAGMTAALRRLAEGESDVAIPATDRTDEIGDMAKAFGVFHDNANALERAHAAMKDAQQQADALARHDPLTGLPNRRVFASELQAALTRSADGGPVCSVFMIDVDEFKSVNDMQGHAVGDRVLCEVASRLRAAVRRSDTVARMGGDEFAVVSETDPGTGVAVLERIAADILDAVHAEIPIDGGSIRVGISVGIASSTNGLVTGEELLRAADIALYQAKEDGRGIYRFFEQRMHDELRAQAALEADLRTALSNDEIRPYYQPLVDIDANQVYGFELLARWTHPLRGSVPPDVFVPLAERLGLVPDLTWKILRRACRDARHWPAELRLALNVSPLHLRDPNLPLAVMAILTEEGFAPSRLEIELTESALIGEMDLAKKIVSTFQDMGATVALDDFGTGYSSLNHLRELRFDKVKIDRLFIQSMCQDHESEKIVDAIVGLSHSLRVPVLAEGIEARYVVDRLISMGCRYGQGYFFGKPMPAEQITEMLATHRFDDITNRASGDVRGIGADRKVRPLASQHTRATIA